MNTRVLNQAETTIRNAGPADADAIVTMMEAFYAEDDMPFDPGRADSAVRQLLEAPDLGRAWIAERHGEIAGYAVLTLGFSLEYMGRDGFVDDLYVRPGHRGRGIGTAMLGELLGACQVLRVRALHLEVGRGKAGAQSLYRRFGFVDHDRLLMTHKLDIPDG